MPSVFGPKTALRVTICALWAVSCAKQTQPASNAQKSTNSNLKQDVKHTTAAVGRTAVGVGNRVERGASRVTRKLNEGADAIDAALKGK